MSELRCDLALQYSYVCCYSLLTNNSPKHCSGSYSRLVDEIPFYCDNFTSLPGLTEVLHYYSSTYTLRWWYIMTLTLMRIVVVTL